MYDASRNKRSKRSSVLTAGSTFTPPQKIPLPQVPQVASKKNETTDVDFEQNRCRDISAEKAAPALQILIAFYRLFGFSFGGVLFVRKPPLKTKPEPLKEKPKFGSRPIEVWSASSDAKTLEIQDSTTAEFETLKPKSFFSPFRLLLLLYNLFIVVGYLMPVITDHLPVQTAKKLLSIHGAEVSEEGNNTTSNLRPLNFGEYFARTGDDEAVSVAEDSFSQLKPVIRVIIRSLVAVFFLEGAVSFLHSLIFGGTLLRRLAAISTQDLEARALQGKAACTRRHSVAVIAILLFSIPLLMSAGMAIFNQEESSSARPFFTASRLHKLAIHWWHFIALSTYSTLFVVAMLMIRRRLEEMITKVEAASSSSQQKKMAARRFSEADLAALYLKVESLLGYFRTTVACFSLPITFILAASTFTLIGSVCFLMISPDRSYASFIFSIGLFALLRLFVVASSGNLASAAYGRLLRSVYEAMGSWNEDEEDEDNGGSGDDWSVDAWLLFGELRRLKADFKVAFFAGTFIVRQSSILALVGFSIQYIVILLQTENYDGGSGSFASTLNLNFSS